MRDAFSQSISHSFPVKTACFFRVSHSFFKVSLTLLPDFRLLIAGLYIFSFQKHHKAHIFYRSISYK